MKKLTALFLAANLLFAQSASAGGLPDISEWLDSKFDNSSLHPTTKRYLASGAEGLVWGGVLSGPAGFMAAGIYHADIRAHVRFDEEDMDALWKSFRKNGRILAHLPRRSELRPEIRLDRSRDFKAYKEVRLRYFSNLHKLAKWRFARYLRWTGVAALAGGLAGSALAVAFSPASSEEKEFVSMQMRDNSSYFFDVLREADIQGHSEKFNLWLSSLRNALDAERNAERKRVLLEKNLYSAIFYWRETRKASIEGFRKILDVLMEHGADINVHVGDYHIFPLYLAMEREDLTAFLLSVKGVNPNIQDEEGWTPLMRAVTAGYLNSAKLLLKAGADKNMKDKEGMTALDIAKDYRFVQFRKEFIELLEGDNAPNEDK